MRSSLLAGVFLAGLVSPIMAADISIPNPIVTPISRDDLNKQIEQTNFVLGDGAQDFCSATLISQKYKLVLTNNHCVRESITQVTKDDTSEGEVKSKTFEVWHDMTVKQLAYKDFKAVGTASLQAEIAAHEEKFDLAILHIKADKIPQAAQATVGGPDMKVTRGDSVYVVGNPFMFDANLTKGVISSTTRTLTWQDGTEIDYYGVDAGVNPGNSGGALYAADGSFIGVPGAAIRGATGLGFAIPLPTIQNFLKANCYEDVYNPTGETHDACLARKLDELNKARDKRGLTALKELPVSHMITGAGVAVTQDKTGLLPNTKLLGPVFDR